MQIVAREREKERESWPPGISSLRYSSFHLSPSKIVTSNTPISQHRGQVFPVSPTWIILAYLPLSRSTSRILENEHSHRIEKRRKAIVALEYQLPTYLPVHETSSRADVRSSSVKKRPVSLPPPPLLSVSLSLLSTLPFRFGKRSSSTTSSIVAYCAFERLLVTLCRCYGTICGFHWWSSV